MTAPAQAVSVRVAQAVAAQLLAASTANQFCTNITPERSYADWSLPLADNDVLHVDVVAVTTKQLTELGSRGQRKYTVPIDIGVRQRFGAADQNDDTGRIEIEKVDGLMLLVEQIHELFEPNRLADFECAAWQSTEIIVAPDRATLLSRQFLAIVRVTFLTSKTI